MNRRRFLRLTGASATAGLAGCGGGASADGTPLEDHPAAADLDAQPSLGALDTHLVLAFEDPSCERCAAFHANTVPKLKTNLLDTGKAGYVVRTYPVVFPWGEPATQALEATFDRSSDAFWALLEHSVETRSAYDPDTVFDRPRSFLDSETAVDGAAVVRDAENEAFDDRVQADVAAAENAGLGRTTPIVLLFRDGTFVTKASGSISYEVISRALEVET